MVVAQVEELSHEKQKDLAFNVQSRLTGAYLDLWHVYKSLTNVNNCIVGYVKGGQSGERPEGCEGQGCDVVVTQVELHQVRHRLQGASDCADHIQTEIQRLQRAEVLERPIIYVLNPVVMEVNQLEVAESFKSITLQLLNAIFPEDESCEEVEASHHSARKCGDEV